MSYFTRITMVGEVGNKRFVLPTGEHTKTFYDASEFNSKTGHFSIFDEQGKVIEFMDLMGRFTKVETELAKHLSYYVRSGDYIPIKTYTDGDYYYSGVVDFPSKFLADDEVRAFIKSQEDHRYRKLCKLHCFVSLFERLSYKRYISKLWKFKIEKMQNANRAQSLTDE